MEMTGASVASLFLAFLVVEGQPCQSSGFGGCECNILGACDINGNKVQGLDNNPTLTGYAPSGIEQFAFTKGGPNSNLAYLCEGGTVAILYDCNARIPLYTATVMTAAQLNMGYKRPNLDFQASRKLDRAYQQDNGDYKHSSQRNLRYESRGASGRVGIIEDKKWKAAAGQKRNRPTNRKTPKNPIHKGHLIAARYGRGNKDRVKATFTYTNVVPQFGTSNSGAWNNAEGGVVTWARQNCAQNGAHTYIVVGAVPSTYGRFNRRFFGESGFSDYQSWSQLQDTYGQNTGKKEYRVNVPEYMWTAACCTFQFQDENGQLKNGVRSRAFYGENNPGSASVTMGLFIALFPEIQGVDIFPQNAACKNYNQ